jgi:hypothetical protein
MAARTHLIDSGRFPWSSDGPLNGLGSRPALSHDAGTVRRHKPTQLSSDNPVFLGRLAARLWRLRVAISIQRAVHRDLGEQSILSFDGRRNILRVR